MVHKSTINVSGGGGVTSINGISGAATLVAGSNVTITNNSPIAGDITIAASAGTPGGSTGDVQYNNAGTFAGDPDFRTNGNGDVTLNSVSSVHSGATIIDENGSLAYADGSQLTDTGSIYYPGGNGYTAIDENTIYYSDGGVLATSSGLFVEYELIGTSSASVIADNQGQLYYTNGAQLTDSGGNLRYSGGDILTDPGENLYVFAQLYAGLNGSVIADSNGFIYYPNGNLLADNGYNLYLSDSGGLYTYGGNNLIIDSGGTIYTTQGLRDGSTDLGSTGKVLGNSGGIPAWVNPSTFNFGLTAGLILFGNGSGGTIAEDSTFKWDVANHRLGIGTASPAAALSVGSSSQFQVDTNGNLIKLNNVTTSFPSANAVGALVNNGSGTFSYQNIGVNTPGILSTITAINGKTVANTALYTVPTGKTCIVTGYTVRVSAASAITNGPAAGVGNVAGTNNIAASQAMNALTATTTVFRWPIVGMSVSTPAASIIYFNLGTAATGTSETLIVDLEGYLV